MGTLECGILWLNQDPVTKGRSRIVAFGQTGRIKATCTCYEVRLTLFSDV